MRVCFRSPVGCLLAMSVAVVCSPVVSADSARVRHSVRVDAHTGHLVRSVVVAPKPAAAKQSVAPQTAVEPSAAEQTGELNPVAAPDPKVSDLVEAVAKEYD